MNKVLGKVSFTVGGAYSSSAVYPRLVIVTGNDGCSYISTRNNVTGIEPGVSANWQNYWQVVSLRGAKGDPGDTYVLTEADKEEIAGLVQDMQKVTVAGTDPVIAGVRNTQYICGEVYTISITPPADGIVDVRFTSGSTAAVLTVPNTVIFPPWFDKTNLETNTTYEINIQDGTYAVLSTWDA